MLSSPSRTRGYETTMAELDKASKNSPLQTWRILLAQKDSNGQKYENSTNVAATQQYLDRRLNSNLDTFDYPLSGGGRPQQA